MEYLWYLEATQKKYWSVSCYGMNVNAFALEHHSFFLSLFLWWKFTLIWAASKCCKSNILHITTQNHSKSQKVHVFKVGSCQHGEENLHCHHFDGQWLAFAKNNGQGHEFGSYINLVDKQIIIFLCTLLVDLQSKDIHETCNLFCPWSFCFVQCNSATMHL